MGIFPYRDIYDHKGIFLYVINTDELMASVPRAIVVEKQQGFIMEQICPYIEEYINTYYRADYEDETCLL